MKLYQNEITAVYPFRGLVVRGSLHVQMHQILLACRWAAYGIFIWTWGNIKEGIKKGKKRNAL